VALVCEERGESQRHPSGSENADRHRRHRGSLRRELSARRAALTIELFSTLG
jgi:hypothetical protein